MPIHKVKTDEDFENYKDILEKFLERHNITDVQIKKVGTYGEKRIALIVPFTIIA